MRKDLHIPGKEASASVLQPKEVGRIIFGIPNVTTLCILGTDSPSLFYVSDYNVVENEQRKTVARKVVGDLKNNRITAVAFWSNNSDPESSVITDSCSKCCGKTEEVALSSPSFSDYAAKKSVLNLIAVQKFPDFGFKIDDNGFIVIPRTPEQDRISISVLSLHALIQHNSGVVVLAGYPEETIDMESLSSFIKKHNLNKNSRIAW